MRRIYFFDYNMKFKITFCTEYVIRTSGAV